MATPHQCPVCNGRGTVPNGFYNSDGMQYSSAGTWAETCRSCGGTGVVWEREPVMSSPPEHQPTQPVCYIALGDDDQSGKTVIIPIGWGLE